MGRQILFPVLKRNLLIMVTGTLIFGGGVTSCGGNVFSDMSGKHTQAAIIEDVRKLTNSLQFTEAVALIENYPDSARTRDDKLLFASAYAGACGLTFATIFDSLQTASGAPMQFMMSSFTNTLIDPPKCAQAQSWIESIGISTARTTNENIAMFLIGMAKVGTYLRHRADNDPATGLGNGTVDGGYDSCMNASLPIAEVKQVMSGFGLMIENISAIGSNLSGGMNGNINDVNTACSSVGIDCEVTDASSISDSDADSFRNAIDSDNSSGLGIGSCATFPMCC